ncbi:MAG: V-type ATP synthase subunit E [Bacteroidota bacterium]
MTQTLNNIDQLVDKIYKEGIEKAEKESNTILTDTQASCRKMLEDAKSEADKILVKARQEADSLSRSIENELKLKSKQMVSDLKAEITNLIGDKVVKENVKAAYADTAFFQSVILEAIKHWSATKGLQLILPESLEDKVKKTLQSTLKTELPDLNVTFNDKLESGFRINSQEDGYLISFTDEDFINLFRTYLTEQADQLLFAD